MIVNGVDIPEATLTSTLASLGPGSFGVRDLQTALETGGVDPAISYDAAKRLLQRERKAGTYGHDPATGLWTPMAVAVAPTGATATNTPPVPPTALRTLPLHPGAAPASPTAPPAPASPPPATGRSFGEALRDAVAYLACLAAVAALALINASFAWEIAETDAFRLAFVTGLMASDLMRPLLVAQGLWEMAKGHILRGMMAMLVAFALAPVSVLSSTAVISAALHLGAEEIEQDGVQSQARLALQAEYDRLKARTEQAWSTWKAECDRGGCGPMAAEREAAAQALEAETQARLDALLSATDAASGAGPSSFLSRTVKAYQDLGLFSGGTEAVLPLLLALTLEIAALFGPGLLLASRRKSA